MPSFVPTTADIAESYWQIEDMVLALKLAIPKNIVLERYDYSTQTHREDRDKKKKRPIANLYNYFI
jgi:hypothetical protein